MHNAASRARQRTDHGGEKAGAKAKAHAIDIGIGAAEYKAIAVGLSRLLADSYTLYLKTHNYHWNVTRPMFNTLHLMFEAQYKELDQAVDVIAERIRALGYPAPGSCVHFGKLSAVKEPAGVSSAKTMIANLVNGQQTIIKTAREIFPHAEQAGDQATMDVLTQRKRTHEKTVWMLRALLE